MINPDKIVAAKVLTLEDFYVPACEKLVPEGGWRVNGSWDSDTGKATQTIDLSDCEIDEDGNVIVTVEEIEAEAETLKAAYDAVAFQRKRIIDYPDFNEQFDLLYHAIDAGALDKTSSFYTTLKKVKDDNSKP